MRGLGSGVVGTIAIAFAIVASASCSYGTYDGGSDDGGDGALAYDVRFTPGTPLTTQTADRYLFLQIPGDAFATATTIHVTRLPDRTSGSRVVPAFAITADAPLTGRIGIQFVDESGGGGQDSQNPFVVGQLENATLTPLPITGTAEHVVWGVTTKLGTFTVEPTAVRGYDRNQNRSPHTPSCFDKCCLSPNQPNENATAGGTRAGCYCNPQANTTGGPANAVELRCFFACANLVDEAARCTGRAFVEGDISCPGGGAMGSNQCSTQMGGGALQSTPPCCTQQPNMGPGTICGLSGCNNPTGPIRRCGGKANCGSGECCLFPDDNEYRCAATCGGQKL